LAKKQFQEKREAVRLGAFAVAFRPEFPSAVAPGNAIPGGRERFSTWNRTYTTQRLFIR